MRPVTDDVLLTIAQISATLTGLFLVGVFFYISPGGPTAKEPSDSFGPYLRAGTRIVLVLFAVPVAVSLSLVVLDDLRSGIVFAAFSLVLVAMNVDTVLRLTRVDRASRTPALVLNEIVSSGLVVVLVILPWSAGGLVPTREHLTAGVLIALAAGFLSTAALVLSAFDASVGGSAPRPPHGREP